MFSNKENAVPGRTALAGKRILKPALTPKSRNKQKRRGKRRVSFSHVVDIRHFEKNKALHKESSKRRKTIMKPISTIVADEQVRRPLKEQVDLSRTDDIFKHILMKETQLEREVEEQGLEDEEDSNQTDAIFKHIMMKEAEKPNLDVSAMNPDLNEADPKAEEERSAVEEGEENDKQQEIEEELEEEEEDLNQTDAIFKHILMKEVQAEQEVENQSLEGEEEEDLNQTDAIFKHIMMKEMVPEQTVKPQVQEGEEGQAEEEEDDDDDGDSNQTDAIFKHIVMKEAESQPMEASTESINLNEAAQEGKDDNKEDENDQDNAEENDQEEVAQANDKEVAGKENDKEEQAEEGQVQESTEDIQEEIEVGPVENEDETQFNQTDAIFKHILMREQEQEPSEADAGEEEEEEQDADQTDAIFKHLRMKEADSETTEIPTMKADLKNLFNPEKMEVDTEDAAMETEEMPMDTEEEEEEEEEAQFDQTDAIFKRILMKERDQEPDEELEAEEEETNEKETEKDEEQAHGKQEQIEEFMESVDEKDQKEQSVEPAQEQEQEPDESKDVPMEAEEETQFNHTDAIFKHIALKEQAEVEVPNEVVEERVTTTISQIADSGSVDQVSHARKVQEQFIILAGLHHWIPKTINEKLLQLQFGSYNLSLNLKFDGYETHVVSGSFEAEPSDQNKFFDILLQTANIPELFQELPSGERVCSVLADLSVRFGRAQDLYNEIQQLEQTYQVMKDEENSDITVTFANQVSVKFHLNLSCYPHRALLYTIDNADNPKQVKDVLKKNERTYGQLTKACEKLSMM